MLFVLTLTGMLTFNDNLTYDNCALLAQKLQGKVAVAICLDDEGNEVTPYTLKREREAE